jgi:TatD DNase family protein
MIDAHCHLEHMDAESVVKEARHRGMAAIVTSTPDIKEAENTLEFHKHNRNFVFVCLGFHPEHSGKYNDEDLEKYIDFLRRNSEQISAIGEVGVDYNWIVDEEGRERSKQIFGRFIELSKELDLPLVIHSRNSREPKDITTDGIANAIEVLEKHNARRVMMHCFSGSEGQLKRCIANGWMISFATVICKSFKHQRLAKETPLEQMLLETDAPWLDPDSRELVNRPWKIERSAEVIAKLKETTKEEILATTTETAKRFFGI